MKHIYLNQHDKKGFIALISVLIITAFLTLLAFSESIAVFYSNQALLEYEFGRQAEANALACIQFGILRLGEDIHYSLTAPVEIIENKCTLVAIQNEESFAEIIGSAEISGIVRTIKATVSLETFLLLNLEPDSQ